MTLLVPSFQLLGNRHYHGVYWRQSGTNTKAPLTFSYRYSIPFVLGEILADSNTVIS